LNTAKNQTKSKRGGRRPGAGRKPNPDSIRQYLAEARANNYNHSYTKWEVEREVYIAEHGTALVTLLTIYRNKIKRPILSRYAAYRIAHFPKEDQALWLARCFPQQLLSAYEIYKDSENERELTFANLCLYVYEHQRLPKGLSAK
jgi:hypothetical protein